MVAVGCARVSHRVLAAALLLTRSPSYQAVLPSALGVLHSHAGRGRGFCGAVCGAAGESQVHPLPCGQRGTCSRHTPTTPTVVRDADAFPERLNACTMASALWSKGVASMPPATATMTACGTKPSIAHSFVCIQPILKTRA